jgi:hypothetical protein
VLGNLLLDRAMLDPEQAIEHWLPLAVTAWERCLTIGERPDLEGSVAGRGSHLAQHNIDAVRSQLALLGGQLERDQAAGILVTHSEVAAATAQRTYRLTHQGLAERAS